MSENANLYALLRARFAAELERPCLIAPEGPVWTYGELDEWSARFAAALRARGVRPGDRVAAQVEKSFVNIALYLGALRAGAVYAPLNTAYTHAEIGYFLDDCEPALFVCEPGRESARARASVELGRSPQDGLWAEAAHCAPDPLITQRGAEDLAALVYTSGTTGRSKGAMLPHRALSSNALTLHEIWGFEPDDVLIHALPLFHVHGLFIALHTALLNASPIHFLNRFDAAQVRALLPRASVLMGVPTFYTRLLEEPGFGATDCRSMRLFISGSAPLTAQASQAWTARTGHEILERYGMSEAGMITSNPLKGKRIPGTVGFALPGVEVRVCSEDGRALGPGETGTVEMRGPNLFTGYWRKPDKTAEDMRPDGFFITGDLGFLDEAGRLTLVGRAKDLIISGGFNIYPPEIEAVLDAVEGIRESAAIGLPHPDMGEGVVAVLVAEASPPSLETLQAALDAALARFKHPRLFFWTDALPRNAMGKVQKNLLRETHRDAFADRA